MTSNETPFTAVPILVDHDIAKKPVGYVEVTRAGLEVTFMDDVKVTAAQVRELLGNAGVMALECSRTGDETHIRKLRILEWSVPAIVLEWSVPAIALTGETAND